MSKTTYEPVPLPPLDAERSIAKWEAWGNWKPKFVLPKREYIQSPAPNSKSEVTEIIEKSPVKVVKVRKTRKVKRRK